VPSLYMKKRKREKPPPLTSANFAVDMNNYWGEIRLPKKPRSGEFLKLSILSPTRKLACSVVKRNGKNKIWTFSDNIKRPFKNRG